MNRRRPWLASEFVMYALLARRPPVPGVRVVVGRFGYIGGFFLGGDGSRPFIGFLVAV
ncbi:hypothetical protein CHLRE_08g373370v5 [Chlamydomonas reinhardtii]|uniref:Uncharacterized protein n=1 Tax=Chlamydomonas reinhardtii TaxID=3055 RepID=A0A2K3DHC7_CHLRE|nr:uncharacterized protein CHLRE_23g754797v5 [Chlamydomonas reinhardtii]XP_042922076.1 uncharacterized protein CHLRE_08g373345v5 [Chlamydomonas reinhardtii]XP_042922102.1 uncharacterized protein CHLRE_08g373370v5 [Chlamydomonas reinhardtii]PNW69718.1 hypothetical protein CHLRE_23g754797v5 [Chlamydomonas reinhardtii]PNW79950.1 hypothetical protein CHLRE_08g373345v5 [Chlamydomonas reinhardtii]PNW79977.1 hypothetical protein CHLRE_08g373370v5 [Chlamydomonas reinhardtii]